MDVLLKRFADRPAAPFVRRYLERCSTELRLVISRPEFGDRPYLNIKPAEGGKRLASITPGSGRTQFYVSPDLADAAPRAEVVLNNGVPNRVKVMLTSDEAVEDAITLTRRAMELT